MYWIGRINFSRENVETSFSVSIFLIGERGQVELSGPFELQKS